MSFKEQFKIILWKNWKIFRQKTFLFLIGGEIIVTIMIICTLAIRDKQDEEYDISASTNLTDISYNYMINSEANTLAFVLPKNQLGMNGDDFVNNFMNDSSISEVVQKKKEKSNDIKILKFESEQKFEEYSNKDNDDTLIAGIIFNNDYNDYSIRIKGSNIVDTKKNPLGNYGQSRHDEIIMAYSYYMQKYYIRGMKDTESDTYKNLFVPLQMALDRTIIKWKTNNTVHHYTAEIGKLSKAKVHYILNEEQNRKASYSGYAPVIAFMFVAQIFHLSNRLMEEKENKIREGLIAIGANRILLWLTWAIIYLPASIITVVLAIVFDPPKLMGAINPIIFFITLFLYAISIYEVVVIFSLISKKGKTVTMLICFFLFALIKINELVYDLKYTNYEKIEKILSLIFSPIGISMAASTITYEDNKNGHIGFSNLFESGYGIYVVFLIIDIIAYFFIAVVIDYTSGINFRTIGIKKSQKIINDSSSLYDKDIQEDPVGSECYVQVKNIYKFFKFRRDIVTDNDEDNKFDKVFAANNNISFNVYKDEIFAILGHNGAGKSTLIQNMVGMLKPDNGDTYYGGLPISKNKKEINPKMGICLQSNILIENFTVADHYKLFSGIKGVTIPVDNWLKDIDLTEKRDYEVQKLSGGQKRKLCIGLALIGNPKYVFLDEPTTGLDPLSRRKIWSLLLKNKKDRVIFITTHYMDEADIIADRKLILNKGVIRCLGSSVYLKNHFRMKYSLEVETQDSESIEAIIKHYIPKAEYFNNKTILDDKNININSFDNNHLTDSDKSTAASSCSIWKLPIDSSGAFSSLLKHLEKEKGDLLQDFSLNAPLLEELFINLEKENESENKFNYNLQKAIELPNNELLKRPSDVATALRLASYRIKLYFRRKLYLLMAVLLPFIIFISIFPYFNNTIKNLDFFNNQKLDLSPQLYKNQQWNYAILDSDTGMNNTITQQIIENELPKMKNNKPGITYNSQKDMESICQSVSNEPYYISSFSGNYLNNQYQFKVYYNDSILHSLPSTINALSNAILAYNQINDTIKVSSHPYAFYNSNSLTTMNYYGSLVIAISVAFALSFYGLNIVHEKSANLLKQLQLNGISNKSYWLSLIFSDYLWFLVTCIIIVISIIICKFAPLYYFNILLVISGFLIICSLGCILFQYCISFIFKSENSAYVLFLLVNILPTFYFVTETYKINGDNESDEFTDFIYYSAFFIDTIFPSYCFIRVFKNLILIGIKHQAISYSISFASIFSKKSQILPHFVGAFLSIILYAFVLVTLVKKIYTPNRRNVFEITDEKRKDIEEEMKQCDDDVFREYERVNADAETNKIPIKLVTLTKEYDHFQFISNVELREAMERKNPKYGEYHISDLGARRIVMKAFQNMTLGINKCECFGILGPNGSGKSSLLNTASFTFKQTIGDIYYDGQNTLDRKGNEITLGYCPQEDTLWSEMTLYEHIEMFLYIRGYSKEQSKRLANQFIHYCRLTSHKNKLPSELSGGTRRKLNILIALCCSSSKVILDEPSAGMDPSTRRYVWDIIKATLQNNQSATIITTHSMEEAELLCNRIGIMVNGKLQCIGTPEHLKMKFGHTYILDVHTDDVEKFHQEVVVGRDLFNGTHYEREDKSLRRVKYEVTNNNNISRVFEIMESCREIGLFTDYSYSQTSLEQVFLNFAALKEKQE
jgi:ABC-type multidrug transport system ATPase subunit